METVPSPGFGTLLRRYRQAAGLSQEDLAERARLSARTVGDLERGAHQAPRKDTVDLLAQALNLPAPERATLAEAARRLSTAASPRPASNGPSSSALVGRRRELALLERHLGGQGPPVLLLAGQPGIGKTRLLHAALPRAAGHGLRVLEGGCQRRGGHEPYAPLLGALQRHIRHQSPAQQRTELAGCAWLVRLLPELAHGPIEPLPAWTLPPEQERRLMLDAVVRFLTNVAGPAGTLLVLDDLQWAGPDALDLLTVLARSASEVPLRVLGAYRDTEVGPRDSLSVVLADLAQAGLAAQYTLGPLRPEEARQLLAGLLADVADAEPELQQRVLQRAGGVPFFLVSCARALRAGAGGAIPWDLAHSVRQRVGALPPGAQELLGVAAVVGRVVPRRVLAAAAPAEESALLAALEAACGAQLLEEEGAEAYHFLHDVTREVVEAELGVARRMVLHRRVAEALEQQPGEPPVELLAYHYERSGAPERAVRYLAQAADRAAAQHAHAAASGYYRDLVDRLEGLGRAREAAAAREKLGAVLRTMARYDVALDVLEQAITAYRTAGDLEGVRRTLAQIGQVHAARGTAEHGVRRLQAALEAVGSGEPSPGLAALYAALAFLFFASGRPEEQLMAAQRATDLARAVGDTSILADAENRRGLALLLMGRFGEALRVLEEVIPLAEAAGNLGVLSRALNNARWVCTIRGEFARGKAYVERAVEIAERLGEAAQLVFARMGRGTIEFFTGDWTQARRDLEHAVGQSRPIAAPRIAAPALAELGRVALAEGAWEEASRHLEEGLALAERSAEPNILREVQTLLAERDVLAGHPETARGRLAPLLAGPGTEGVVTFLLPTLAWAYSELGDVAQASTVVVQAITRARAQEQMLALVDALRVHAMVAIRQEHWEDAAGALQEGLALAQSMPYPYAEARFLHVYGKMHVQKGEPEPARARLEAARAIFRRLGARKDAEQVAQALTDLQRP